MASAQAGSFLGCLVAMPAEDACPLIDDEIIKAHELIGGKGAVVNEVFE